MSFSSILPGSITLFVLSLFIWGRRLAALETKTQREVLQKTLPKARLQSLLTSPTMLTLFANPSTRKFLQEFDDGSELWKLTPIELADMFWKEISIAELVHNFGDGVSASANCGYDLDIEMGMLSKAFYNQWQLQAMGMTPTDEINNEFMEWSEVNLFTFPPFQNTSEPDMRTSTDRPFYAALNMYRSSGGNPQVIYALYVTSSFLFSSLLSLLFLLTPPYYPAFFSPSSSVAEYLSFSTGRTCQSKYLQVRWLSQV